MQIVNQTRGSVMADRVWQARTFFQRLLGLGRLGFWSKGGGLYLSPCQWVHTLGMGFAIDVVYLDPRGRVVALETLKPWRIGRWVRGASGVLELPAGTCRERGCEPGDQLAGLESLPHPRTEAGLGGEAPRQR